MCIPHDKGVDNAPYIKQKIDLFKKKLLRDS